MEKLKVLLIVLVAATLGLAVSLFLLALSQVPAESPIDLLYRILTKGLPSDVPLFIPISPLLFLTTALASMVGVIYFLVLPEMKNYYHYYESDRERSARGATEMVMRTLKPEERQVVKILEVHGGTYLQKYITKEAGLSKLKTHRVVAGLSERGIVNVAKRGNTNEVSLAKWLLSAAENE